MIVVVSQVICGFFADPRHFIFIGMCRFSYCETFHCSPETGARQLPKLRAFQEPCLSFHHETVRIIYFHVLQKLSNVYKWLFSLLCDIEVPSG